MSTLDSILQWIISGAYGLYGVFSLFCAYNILHHKNFRFVNGFDERYKHNLKNEEKFAREYSLPHILVGLSCLLGFAGCFIYGLMSLLVSIIVTIAIFFYGTAITRRLPERLRRGRYM